MKNEILQEQAIYGPRIFKEPYPEFLFRKIKREAVYCKKY
jgi:hypothetical protein